MQIQTRDNQPSVEISITTLGLAQDRNNPDRTFLLHCYKCGRELMQMQGKLTRVINWLEPTADPIVITTCSRCREKYTTQATPFTAEVLVRIVPLPEFHCLICHLAVMNNSCIRCHTAYDFKYIV